MALQNLTITPPGDLQIIPAPMNVQGKLLAANVPETVTPPTGAQIVKFKSTGDFYVKYRKNALQAADSTTNGTFAADASWTKGTGWTIAAGVATATGAISTDLSQTPASTLALVPGQVYLVTYTMSGFAAGTLTVKIGTTSGTARSSNATFAEYIVAGAGTDITFTGAGFTGNIDNVSVVPVAYVPVDNSTGAASELNPDWRYIGDVTDFSVASASTPTITMLFFG